MAYSVYNKIVKLSLQLSTYDLILGPMTMLLAPFASTADNFSFLFLLSLIVYLNFLAQTYLHI